VNNIVLFKKLINILLIINSTYKILLNLEKEIYHVHNLFQMVVAKTNERDCICNFHLFAFMVFRW